MPPIQLRPVRGSAPRGYDPHLVEPSVQENVPQRVLADRDERRWMAGPRTGSTQRHELLENLLIALSATLCAAKTCVDMAVFSRAKERFLRGFLRLAGGVPSHDTFRACSGCSIRAGSPPPSAIRSSASRWWQSTASPPGARSTTGAAARSI